MSDTAAHDSVDPSTTPRRRTTLLVAGLTCAVAVAAGALAGTDTAMAGTTHPIGAVDVVGRQSITALGWSTRDSDVTTYEDLGTSQSTIEPCQRASLYAEAGQSDVYTTNIYDRDQQFAGESVTQVDSPQTASELADRLNHQVAHCGTWHVRAHHRETNAHGAVDWYRLADPTSGTRYEVVAFIRSGRRVALLGLTPRHRLTSVQIDDFLDRAEHRLRG